VWCRVDEDEAVRRCSGTEKYEHGVVQGLIDRFEEPKASNRWDKPLFVADPVPSESGQLRFTLDLDVVVTALLHSTSKLIPVLATKQPIATKANLLHEVDRATFKVQTDVIERLVDACPGDSIPVSGSSKSVVLTR